MWPRQSPAPTVAWQFAQGHSIGVAPLLAYQRFKAEGLQAFTAAKLRGVPAKFLYFPDEDHFVTKPRNRRLWWDTVLDWLDESLH